MKTVCSNQEKFIKSEKEDRGYIRHVVFFSVPNPSNMAEVTKGLSLLSEIPEAINFEVSQNSCVDHFSNEVDLVVYAEFTSEEALKAYKSHPNYQRSIEIVRPLRGLRFAADF